MPGCIRRMICICIKKRIRMCSGCTCHMQMMCDILPPTEVHNGKHRRDMPSVCDLLYECGYSNSQSAEMPWLMTSTYLVCKEHFSVALGDIGFTTDFIINSVKVNIVLRRVL